MDPQSHPRGYGFCFLTSTLAPYWIIVGYVNDSYFWFTSVCGEQWKHFPKAERVLISLRDGERNQHRTGQRLKSNCKRFNLIWGQSLFLWILPYPVPTESSVWVSVQHYEGWGACDLGRVTLCPPLTMPIIPHNIESFPPCCNSAMFSTLKHKTPTCCCQINCGTSAKPDIRNENMAKNISQTKGPLMSLLFWV